MSETEIAIPKAGIPEIAGSCLCGAVRIELTDARPQVEICHCSMCRQWGGGPFMGVSSAGFSLSGQDHVISYRSSEWAERAFCRTCGSNLYYRFIPSDHYSFCSGLFDFGETVSISKQIFVDEKPAFYDFAQQTPMQTGPEVIAEAVAAGFTFPDQAEQS